MVGEGLVRHPNRANARKSKVGGSCAMCKPHKHKWEHKFKAKNRNKKKEQIDV